MDADALLLYLTRKWAKVIARARINLDFVIEQVAEVNAASDGLSEAWIRKLGSYFLLELAVNTFITDFKVSVGGDSFSLEQRKDVERLFNALAADVAWLVEPESDTAGKVITVTTGYLTGDDVPAEHEGALYQ